MAISSALARARDRLAKIHAFHLSVKGRGEVGVRQVVASSEVFAGAVAGGFVDEKFGADEGDGIKLHKVEGVPTNLLLGAGAKLASFMGAFGKQAEHANELGSGFLAAYGAKLGQSIAKRTEAVK